MNTIRVLVVDDSVIVRKLLTEEITRDSNLRVVGTAANGKIALGKISNLTPDVITLDLDMPEMDGIEMLVELRKVYPKLPVILFSTAGHHGAEITIEALSKGATDYVAKPCSTDLKKAMESVREELIPKIRLHHEVFRRSQQNPNSGKPFSIKTTQGGTLALSSPQRNESTQIEIVAIGVSTGGPTALATILREIPKDFPVPIVVVQHMPPLFTRYLATRLNQSSPIEVVEAKHGDRLHPGVAYIAPGDFHTIVSRDESEIILATHKDPPENSCRPSVDVLFRSVAEVFGSQALVCVLTGMGLDGVRGCDHIRHHGGFVLAQDEASSVVWGMPKAVIDAKLANNVLPLEVFASEILKRCKRRKLSTPSDRTVTTS